MNPATHRTEEPKLQPTAESPVFLTVDRREVPRDVRQATLKRLTQEVWQLETAGGLPGDKASISTGCQAMDASLPAGGYVPGSVIEYLRATSGCGASYLALTAAAAALDASPGKYLVMVDTHQQFYPPAFQSHGIDLQRVIWVRPPTGSDAVWATDQALRTPAVAVVVADMERLDERDARRLQLAAQRGGNLGLLLRGLSARRTPSWAEVQWVVRSLLPSKVALPLNAVPARASVTPLPAMRRLEVVLARLRGGRAGARMWLDIDARQGQLHLVSPQTNWHTGAQNLESMIGVERKVAQNSMRMATELARSARASG